MKPPVHQVKLSPLRAAERSEYRMVEQPCLLAELFFRLRNRSVHGCDLCCDLAKHLLWGHSLRRGVRRSLAPLRQLPQADDVERARTILEGRRSCQWFSARQALLKPADRTRVGEVKMLENLGSAPLAGGGSLRQHFHGHSLGHRCDVILKSLQT